VAEPVLANAPRAARGRSVRARLAAAVSDPIIVGAMAMIAVISSIVQMVADEPRQWQHTSLITVSIALLLPVWSVMVAHWPADLRRAQAAAAALTGAFAVILLGVVEPAELADMGHRTQALLLCASAAAAAVVRVVPRRVRSSADSA
jgi:uncharacterized membrane protein